MVPSKKHESKHVLRKRKSQSNGIMEYCVLKKTNDQSTSVRDLSSENVHELTLLDIF